jgi:hypothetical protein
MTQPTYGATYLRGVGGDDAHGGVRQRRLLEPLYYIILYYILYITYYILHIIYYILCILHIVYIIYYILYIYY